MPVYPGVLRGADNTPRKPAPCYHSHSVANRSVRGQEEQLPESKVSSMPPSKALTDLILAVGVVLVSPPLASPSHSPFRRMSALTRVLMLAARFSSPRKLVRPLLTRKS